METTVEFTDGTVETYAKSTTVTIKDDGTLAIRMADSRLTYAPHAWKCVKKPFDPDKKPTSRGVTM